MATIPSRNRSAARVASAASLLCSLLAGCGGDAPAPAGEDSWDAGVRAQGPGGVGGAEGATPGGAGWNVSPGPLLRIGETEGEAPYLFERVAAVALLPGGGVAVADHGSREVRIYDASGRFLRGMGGPGQGPGELEHVDALLLLPPDTLAVYDGGQGRLSRFLTDGTLLSTVAFRADDGWPERLVGRFSDGSWAVARISQAEFRVGGSTPLPDPMKVGRYGPDGASLGLLAEATGLVRLDGRVVPFSPALYGAVVRDTLYLTDGTTSGISVQPPDGGPGGRLSIPVVPPDTRTAWAALHDALAEAGALERLEGTPDGTEEVPIPPVARMLVDDAGRLWLKHLEPSTDSWLLGAGSEGGPGGRWSVLATGGVEVAQVELPGGLVPMVIGEGRVAGVTRDALGVERVEVWGLDAPPPEP
jgi:hypothetical protein